MHTLDSEPCRSDAGPDRTDAFLRHQNAILAFSRRASQPAPGAVLLEDSVIIGGDALQVDLGLVATVAGDAIHADIILPIAGARKSEPHVASFAYALDDRSLAAHALRCAEPAVTADLLTDDRFRDSPLTRLGVAGALMLPLYVNARPMGAVGFLSRSSRNWSAQEISFGETIAHLVTAALARQRAEDELREERDLKSALLEMVDTIVLNLDQDGRIQHVNRACEFVTKFSLDELRGRHFWETLIPPREIELVQSIFRGSRDGRIPSEFSGSLLAKDGSSRHVSWSLRAMAGDDVQSIVLIGSDRTDHVVTTNRLRQMTSVARHAVDAYFGLPGPMAAPAAEHPAAATDNMVSPDSAGGGRERRASPRHSYPYTQMFAPVWKGTMPSADSFVPVQCRDISSHGIGLFLDEPPAFEQIVLTLGCAPVVRRLLCRVVRVAACEIHGRRRYLVGCRFIQRLE